jgi:hypothetical protein
MIYYGDSKKRIIVDMLRAAPEASTQVIAAWVGATPKYVSEVRSEGGFPLLKRRKVNHSGKREVTGNADRA